MSADKILNRVKNLLDLAESDNENEANLALARANDMIREHNISEAELNKDKQKTITVDCEVVDLHEYGYPWSRNLFSHVAKAYHCRAIFIRVQSKINPTKENYAGHLFGTEGDRATVRLMYDYAAEAKKRISKSERKKFKNRYANNDSTNQHMRGFNYGVVDGMCETLFRISKQNRQDKQSEGAYGLVLVSTAKKVNTLFSEKYPTTRSLGGDRSGGSWAREQGRSEGSKVSFNKQTSGRVSGYLGN